MKQNLKYLFVFFALFISEVTYSQYKVTFEVKQPSLLHSMDNLYIAGNFNLWSPDNKDYRLVKDKADISVITLSMKAGGYEYKFTRGSWDKVESTSGGFDIANRQIQVHSDTTVFVKISGWKDDFKDANGSTIKKHSASVNVKIMDSAFYIPELKRTRRIWIYLPPDYSTSQKRYPVLYMQDGQNIFDNASAYSDEWGVDEYLDSISKLNKKEVIVIAIDNGQSKRMNEYNPWQFQNFGKGEGALYVDFLVKNLKPYIDRHFRTLKDKQNTFIAGSSMGGLISFYAVLTHPDVFGGAGIFSPAFWTASGIDSTTLADAKEVNSRFFFYAGGKEGDSMIPDMKRIEKELEKASKSPIKEAIDPNARHNEAAWRKFFPAFYEWTIEGINN